MVEERGKVDKNKQTNKHYIEKKTVCDVYINGNWLNWTLACSSL